MSRKNTDTRTRILEAALVLLEARSGGEVRMADIAKRAGISRQALYLHFGTRVELLIEVTRHLDRIKDLEARLAPSRAARTGPERLDAFIEFWGNYIPEIYAVAKALLAMSDSDEAAARAWNERMRDVRQGCEAAIDALVQDGLLSSALSRKEATDMLWTMLSVRHWEQLTIDCGWPQEKYIETQMSMARRLFVSG
jgi:AcrR family transcriptional regulator